MLQSLSLRAKTSFTPSPVIATVWPLSLSDFIISLFCSGFTLPNIVYLSTALFISSLVLSVDASIYLSAFLIPAVFDISDTVTGLSPDITFISTP